MLQRIDINADIGEGFGNYVMPNDEGIMKLITSANIACGYHAGDPLTMRKTVDLAKKYGVSVGAHPGLPDLMGFGRRVMEISPDEIYHYIIYQVGALKAFAEIDGLRLHHVKPHGAFFRSTKENEEQARAMVKAILDIDHELILYCPGPVEVYHPTLGKVADKMGLRILQEFYADLHYSSSGQLVSPKVQKLEATSEGIAKRVLRFLEEGKVTSIEGAEVAFDVGTICIHGDNPLTLDRLQSIRHVLRDAGITVKLEP